MNAAQTPAQNSEVQYVDEQRRATRFEQSPDEVYAAVWLEGDEATLADTGRFIQYDGATAPW